MRIITKYIIAICASVLARALLSYAQQLYREDQQNADMATAQRDEEAQLTGKDQPVPMTEFENGEIEEDTHVRDFDAEALAIVNALCDKAALPDACVRAEDGNAINITFSSADSDGQEQSFTCGVDCIARQLRQGAEHPDEDYGKNDDGLPYYSYHGGGGKEISKEDFERLAELEIEHERKGTLHLLYPDVYDENYREWYDRLAEDRNEEDSGGGEAAGDQDVAESSFWKPGVERIPARRPKGRVEGEAAARGAAHEAL